MRAFARRLAGSVELADDVVQEAALKAWEKRESYDASRPLRPWLFRIVRNVFLQHCRRSWRRLHPGEEFFNSTMTTECAFSVLSDLSRAEQALSELSPDQRDALVLVLAAGFSYEEVAEVCETSVGTIKSRVSRAREAVQLTMASRAPSRLAKAPGDHASVHGRFLTEVDDILVRYGRPPLQRVA